MLGSVGLRPLDLSSMFACLCNSQSTESQRNWREKTHSVLAVLALKLYLTGPSLVLYALIAANELLQRSKAAATWANDHCLSDNSGVSGRVNRQTQFPQFPFKILHSSLKVFQSYAGASTEINVFRMQTNLPGAPKLVSCAVNHWTNTQGQTDLWKWVAESFQFEG